MWRSRLLCEGLGAIRRGKDSFMMVRSSRTLFLALIIAALLAACAGQAPTTAPTRMPVLPTATFPSTVTPPSTATQGPIPTATPAVGRDVLLTQLAMADSTATGIADDPTAAAPATAVATFTAAPTQTPWTPPSPAPSFTPVPVGQLTGFGPWGLIPSTEGLWVMRPDGTNVTMATNDPILDMSISANGRLIAYITHADPNNLYQHNPFGYTLKILTLPQGQVFTITSIVPAEGSSPDAGETAFQTITAYENGSAMAWSPQGQVLAFVSAHEGKSEIYLFHPSSGAIQRLTDISLPQGPSYPFNLDFSPNSRYLYFTRAFSFGMDEGYWMAGSWVTDLNGQIRQISGEDYEGEKVIRWVTNDQLMLASWMNNCGDQNLRTYNISNGQTNVYWPGCFDSYIFDSRLNEILISVPPGFAMPEQEIQSGLVLIRPWQNTIRQVTDRYFEQLFRGDTWPTGGASGAWFGFNFGEGLFSIQRDGRIDPLFNTPPFDSTGQILLDPYQRMDDDLTWLWVADGVYQAAPGQEPQKILSFRPEQWTDSPIYPNLSFFISYHEGRPKVYGMNTFDWQPYVIDERIYSPQRIIWVGS